MSSDPTKQISEIYQYEIELWLTTNVSKELLDKKNEGESTKDYAGRIIKEISSKMEQGVVSISGGKIVTINVLVQYLWGATNKMLVQEKLQEYARKESNFTFLSNLAQRNTQGIKGNASDRQQEVASQIDRHISSSAPMAPPIPPPLASDLPPQAPPQIPQNVPNAPPPPSAPGAPPLLSGPSVRPAVLSPEQKHNQNEINRLKRELIGRAKTDRFYAIVPPTQQIRSILDLRRAEFQDIASTSAEPETISKANEDIRRIDEELKGTKKTKEPDEIKAELNKLTNDELKILMTLYADHLIKQKQENPEADISILENHQALFQAAKQKVDEMPNRADTSKNVFFQQGHMWVSFLEEQGLRMQLIIELLKTREREKIEVTYEPKPFPSKSAPLNPGVIGPPAATATASAAATPPVGDFAQQAKRAQEMRLARQAANPAPTQTPFYLLILPVRSSY